MKKVFSIVLAVCLVLLSFGAFAEEKPVYLAIGDSITTGYGLLEGEKNFPEIVAEKMGYTLINHAVNGNTADGIMAQMTDPAVQMAALKADVITITCGGNDLMHLLYQYVANIYNAVMPDPLKIQPDDILVILADPTEPRYQSVMLAAQTALAGNEQMGVAPFIESADIQSAMGEYLKNMSTVLMGIKAVNPDVKIIVCTQYNPYKFFDGLFIGMNTAMETGAQLLSTAISTYSLLLGYQVADVYAAFSAHAENLCNADMTTMNLDFHPNAKGHEVIAECVIKAIDAVQE